MTTIPHYTSTDKLLRSGEISAKEAYRVERDHTELTHKALFTNPSRVLHGQFITDGETIISTASSCGTDDGVHVRTMIRKRKGFRFLHVRCKRLIGGDYWLTIEEYLARLWGCSELEAHNRIRKAYHFPELDKDLYMDFAMDLNKATLWEDTRLTAENIKAEKRRLS